MNALLFFRKSKVKRGLRFPVPFLKMRFNPFNKTVFRFWRTVLPLVLIPATELALMLYFLGQPLTVLSVLIGGLIGAFLARRQGIRCWIEMNRQLDQGETPTLPTLHGVLILLAALLLTLPGLLTSLVGLFLFVPLTRSFIVSYLVLYLEAHRLRNRSGTPPSSPEIIDIT